MKTALCVTLVLTCTRGAIGNLDAARPPSSLDGSVVPRITVVVFAPDVKVSLVNRICAETEAIWAPAGITFDWHRISAKDEAAASQLEVTIDDRRKGLPERQVALGWITFTAEGPERSIHLSRSSAEDLLLSTPGVNDKTIAAHETLLGRALGRALSHEIGHYLLQSKVHTPHGLMRAIRPSEEFFGIRRDEFELTAEERNAAARHVQQDKLTEPAP